MATLHEILDLVTRYYAENKKEIPYNKVPVSGKVYDSEELKSLVCASLDGWWTEGEYNQNLENKIKCFLSVKYALTVNSGSSANYVALKSLFSNKLGERRLKKGDEIITVAAGFPTTINPIIDFGAIPVFVDIQLSTYNIDVKLLEQAITPKTKAVFIAHTLGNPFNLKRVVELCKEYNLWLIEDNCDAFGSEYENKKTGSFGDLATISFYPAHHITTAEGGVVLTNNPLLYKIARSIRDWGRDCCCPTGKSNFCGNRFEQQYGKLPFGYDHKFIFSELGYNFKMTDLQAAIGLAQMDKLENFILRRKMNFNFLLNRLKRFEDLFILPQPTEQSDPAWFGFPVTIKNNKLKRKGLIDHLEGHGISTRLLFGGNITKQPYFIDGKFRFRMMGNLTNTNRVTTNAFWIGVYPGLNENHLDYAVRIISEYIESVCGRLLLPSIHEDMLLNSE